MCMAISTFYIVWSLTNIGLIFDKSSWANYSELTRCLVASVHLMYFEPSGLLSILVINAYQWLMGTSVVIWATICLIR